MKELGIAINLYDAWEDLQTNVNIIRKHWKHHNDSFISVVCNHEETFEKAKTLDVDSCILGVSRVCDPTLSFAHKKANHRSRIYKNERTAILNCDSEYVINIHADAFILDVDRLLEMTNKMRKEDIYVAFRGWGLDFRTAKCLNGDVDDHYMVLNLQQAKNSKMLERDDYTETLKVQNNESLYAQLITTYFEEDQMWHYAKGDVDFPRNLNPICLDLKRKFYHIGSEGESQKKQILTGEGVDESLIIMRECGIRKAFTETD